MKVVATPKSSSERFHITTQYPFTVLNHRNPHLFGRYKHHNYTYLCLNIFLDHFYMAHKQKFNLTYNC